MNNNPRTFLRYGECQKTQLLRTSHMGLAYSYANALSSFTRFLREHGQSDLTFRRMKPDIIAAYERWLSDSGICRNASSCYMRALQSIYNKWTLVIPVRDTMPNPFRGIYRGVAKTRKRAVGPEVIRSLRCLDIPAALLACGYKKGSRRLASHCRRLSFARDLFLFSFCSRGMSFVDIAYLRKSDIRGGVIRYARHKTHQVLEVQVVPLMREIIDRYATTTAFVFPILTDETDTRHAYQQYRYAIQRINKSLRELGAMLGGLHLTTYVARHSWATAANRHNVPLSVISQSMGHDSLRTTEIYLKSLESTQIDQANRDLLHSVFG